MDDLVISCGFRGGIIFSVILDVAFGVVFRVGLPVNLGVVFRVVLGICFRSGLRGHLLRVIDIFRGILLRSGLGRLCRLSSLGFLLTGTDAGLGALGEVLDSLLLGLQSRIHGGTQCSLGIGGFTLARLFHLAGLARDALIQLGVIRCLDLTPPHAGAGGHRAGAAG